MKMNSELQRVFNNKLSIFIFILVVLLPCVEIVQLLLVSHQVDVKYHPAFAFFLAASSRGHATQVILLWFLPLYFLLLCSDNAIQDHKTGYKYILISKVGKKKYLLKKMGASFCLSFSTMFISLILNFLLVLIIFKEGTFSNSLTSIKLPDNLLFTLSIEHPYIADLAFLSVCSMMAGFAGLLGASTSIFFYDKKYSYTASFFIWFLLVLKRDSLMYLFQPFAEYGFNVLLPILILAVSIFIALPLFVYSYAVKYDEN
jgi:Protein of unknown function (DUF2705)